MPAEDVAVRAKWTINKYTIAFDADGGSAVSSITQDYDTALTAPEAPVKTGYTFAGWEPELPEVMPAEDVAVRAKWTINKYTITFDTDGGSAVASITQEYDTAVTAPANPTKVGYTFTGWEPQLPAKMPAGNVSVKAKWTINKYTITFDADGGSAVASITQDYDTAVTAPANPTKVGYTFAGWEPQLPAKMPAGNVAVKAKWTINRYTITFDTDGGSAVASITQDYNTAVTAPANPTKVGYTFAGWEPQLPAKMPAGDVAVKAKWTINRYTITFDADGGSAVASITQDYNTAVTAPENPTKVGYTFAGWEPQLPAKMPAGSVTLKAKWTALPQGTLLATLTASGKTALKVTWTKLTNVEGYDVFFSQNAGGSAGKYAVKATVAANKTRSATIKGLKQQTEYRAYVRAWVTKDGKKTYVANASPTVYAIAGGSGKKYANPKGIKVTPAKLALSQGGKFALTAMVTSVKSGVKPLNSGGAVRYVSGDAAVAKVSAKGVVTGVKPGSCTVYALASNGVYKAVTVTVGPKLTKLAFKARSYAVKKGKTLQLGNQIALTPANAKTALTWTTSNKKVATVDANGKVKGVKKGTATITAKADNGLKVQVKVTVN